MSRATLKIGDLAERLIAFEARENKSSEIPPLAAYHVCEKLRPHLANLMGITGFRALLSRALAQGGSEIAWLRAVHVKADGSMEGLAELATQVDPDGFLRGEIILIVKLLGLLAAFVGENLTLTIVREVWTKVLLTDLDLVMEEKNEKTKPRG